MNREIKFRAWHKESGTMFDSEPAENDESRYYHPFVFQIGHKRSFGHSDFILMQYIGLNDLKGVEIFEGDIVSCGGRQRTIKWSNGKYWFHFEFGNSYEDISEFFSRYHLEVEVIGNIHQHPELIN